MKFGNLLLVLMLYFPCCLKAQTVPDLAFMRHLSASGKTEVLSAYLYSTQWEETDDINAWRTMLALQEKQYGLFFSSWSKGKTSLLKNEALLGRIACSLLDYRDDEARVKAWFQEVHELAKDTILRQLFDAYFLQVQCGNPLLEQAQLEKDWQQIQQAKRKKPLVGAVFSAVIPGSGSWYAGAPGRALSQLVFQGLLILPVYEGVNRLGWKHPWVLILLPVTSIFYMANIYGGARDIRQLQTIVQHSFYHHVSNYYSVLYYRNYL